MRQQDIKTPHDTYHELWELLDRTQTTTKLVKVDKEVLAGLLIDHKNLFGEVFPNEDYRLRAA